MKDGLYSGKIDVNKKLFIVRGSQMAVSSDFGEDDPWRIGMVHLDTLFMPLDTNTFTDVEFIRPLH